MGEPARERVILQDFPGLVTKPDPDDVQPGAGRIQTNATSSTPGDLRVRPGVRQVLFEDP